MKFNKEQKYYLYGNKSSKKPNKSWKKKEETDGTLIKNQLRKDQSIL